MPFPNRRNCIAEGMGGVKSIVTDHNGTPVAYIDNTNWALPVGRIRTDPFGTARPGQEGVLEQRGFLGAPSESSGITLLGARHHDNVAGAAIGLLLAVLVGSIVYTLYRGSEIRSATV